MTKARILADYVAGGTTAAEFDYMDGVTSNVQTQLDAKAPKASPAITGGMTVDGATVFNEASADVDFRIEGNGDANLFYADAGNDRVGIGTANPLSDLHVYSDTDHTRMSIQCADSSGDHWMFQSRNDGQFWIRNDSTSSTRMCFHDNGDIGINYETLTDCTVTIYNTDNDNGGLLLRHNQTNDAWALIMDQQNTSYDVGMIFRKNGDNRFFVKLDASADSLFVLDNGQNNGVQLGNNTNSWSSAVSDERMKSDWTNFTGAVDKINSLTKIGTYRQIDPITKEYVDENVHIGISAQEVAEFLPYPHTVPKHRRSRELYPDDNEEYYGLTYQDVFVVGLKAIQELSAKIDALETKVTALENA